MSDILESACVAHHCQPSRSASKDNTPKGDVSCCPLLPSTVVLLRPEILLPCLCGSRMGTPILLSLSLSLAHQSPPHAPTQASFSRHNPESFFLVPPSGAIGILAKKEERRKGICDRHSVYSEALSFHSDSSSGSEDVDMPVSPPSSCLGSPDGTTVDTSPFPVGSHDSPHSQRPSWSFSAEPLDLLPNESHQC